MLQHGTIAMLFFKRLYPDKKNDIYPDYLFFSIACIGALMAPGAIWLLIFAALGAIYFLVHIANGDN